MNYGKSKVFFHKNAKIVLTFSKIGYCNFKRTAL